MTTINAYPVDGKRKSFELCQAFVDSCGGKVITDGVLREGAAFFYGVDGSNVDVWRAVQRERRDYFYSDNSYFDATRGDYFRVTRNGLQHSGTGPSNGKRFASLRIDVKPWRRRGDHIVMCPQSDHFMTVIAGVAFDWTRHTRDALARFSGRPLRLREWNRDKSALSATLPADLDGAHALVTWSSAAAVEAVLSGVPVVCTGPCAAAPMGGDIADIECLPTPAREQWAGVLADNQWTVSEFRRGLALDELCNG